MTVDLSALELAAAAGAAFAASVVNTAAGGGTLITFPTLVALGVPAVRANVTNSVALSPGYLGGVVALRTELEGQSRHVRRLALSSMVGGIVGGTLLLVTTEKLFRNIVPWLILGACALLAFQNAIRRRVFGHDDQRSAPTEVTPALQGAVFLAAVYGGYFGAGLGIISLAALGLLLHDSLHRLNALKTFISLVVNSSAALLFVFTGKVVWSAALAMAGGAILGGLVGGKVAKRLSARALRTAVITLGVAVALKLLID